MDLQVVDGGLFDVGCCLLRGEPVAGDGGEVGGDLRGRFDIALRAAWNAGCSGGSIRRSGPAMKRMEKRTMTAGTGFLVRVVFVIGVHRGIFTCCRCPGAGS